MVSDENKEGPQGEGEAAADKTDAHDGTGSANEIYDRRPNPVKLLLDLQGPEVIDVESRPSHKGAWRNEL